MNKFVDNLATYFLGHDNHFYEELSKIDFPDKNHLKLSLTITKKLEEGVKGFCNISDMASIGIAIGYQSPAPLFMIPLVELVRYYDNKSSNKFFQDLRDKKFP